jgi:hypothetical protein
MSAFDEWVAGELEAHLECLKAELEVEVDLHGGRTRMAYDLRTLIISNEKEIERLKSGADEFAGERISASMEDMS